MKDEQNRKPEILKKFESVAKVFHMDCLKFRSEPEFCATCIARGKIWIEEHKGQQIPIYCGIYSINGGELKRE